MRKLVGLDEEKCQMIYGETKIRKRIQLTTESMIILFLYVILISSYAVHTLLWKWG
jgi:hypothetical protein